MNSSAKKKVCCNPLGKRASHSKNDRYLRPFPANYLSKFPHIDANNWLCSACRKDMKNDISPQREDVDVDEAEKEEKQNQASEIEEKGDYEAQNEEAEAEEITRSVSSFDSMSLTFKQRLEELLDHDYTPENSQKQENNQSITDFLGLSPVERKRLCVKNYVQEKLEEVKNAAKEKFESDFKVKTEFKETKVTKDFKYVLSKIKESFQDNISKELKMKLLNLLPPDWSVQKVQEETGASVRLIEEIKSDKKFEEIMKKPGNKPLGEDHEYLIQRFYLDEEYSRVLPGIKDYVTVKDANGTKVKEQKRLVLCNLNELYAAFKDKYPLIKVGFSKFASLRPKQCQLAGASGTHTVCVCTRHQNVKLMLQGCKFPGVLGERPGEEPTYRSLLESLICVNSTDDCWFRTCCQCQSTELITELFNNAFEEQGIKEVKFASWTNVDRCNLVTHVSPVDEFTNMLCENLEKLLPHDFIARKQASYFTELKEDLKPNELMVIMDFAENYAFTVQDAAPGYHWNNAQATVFPIVIYYKENGKLEHISYVGISDCLKHDSVAVYMFQQRLITYLKTKFQQITLIHYFSDGAPQQFKNKKSFINLAHHSTDFGIEAVWNFFPTAHGKGPCDGVGGILKRRAKLASLKNSSTEQILTPVDLFQWVGKNMSNIECIYCTKQDYQDTELLLDLRLKKALTVKGTKLFHYIAPSSNNTVIYCRRFSASETVEKIQIFK